MLHLERMGGSLLMVENEADLKSNEDKLQHWSGVFIKAEPNEQIEHPENGKMLLHEKRQELIAVIGLLSVMGLFVLLQATFFSIVQSFLLITALAGSTVGYFLLARDLGITYRSVESFCNAGTGSGCGKVLSANEGKLFGFITFSDLTLGYFIAQLFTVGILVPLWTGGTIITTLGWMSILAIPIISYSLWLQAVKIKEWCRLCLVVSGILAVQALLFGYLFYSGLINLFAINLPGVAITLLLFGVVGSSLLLLKQVIEQKNLAVQNEIAAVRIKNSIDVFTGLLFRERQVDNTYFDNDFLIGSANAPVNLTMAVNLHCGPCKSELEQAKDLLSIYPELVNLSLRFLKSGDDGKSSGLLLKAWLHQLRKQKNGLADGQSLIDVWYGEMDSDKFSKSHSVNGMASGTETDEYLQTHYNWVKKSEITKTPTIFMNGYELPSTYRVKDLVPLIPGLIDIFTNKNFYTKMTLNDR